MLLAATQMVVPCLDVWDRGSRHVSAKDALLYDGEHGGWTGDAVLCIKRQSLVANGSAGAA